MRGVCCADCFNYKNEWCEKKHDSPDPFRVRTCEYFREATNADRIRAMTDEELGEFIEGIAPHAEWSWYLCKYGGSWLDWLKKEAPAQCDGAWLAGGGE